MDAVPNDAEAYRLILTRRDVSEIFLLASGSGFSLPQVEICPQQRLAEQLTVQARRAWGVEAYCLLVPVLLTCSQNRVARCAVMDAVRQNDKAPRGSLWAPLMVVTDLVGINETRLIQESLEQLNACAKNETLSPFAKPGWLRKLFLWTRQQIAPFGFRLTGAFQQLNASPTFNLIRLETEDGGVWFKATGEPHSSELPVTVALARLFPRFVPPILGVHPTWNGWLSEDVAGVSLDQVADFDAWRQVAEQLAELQIESIGKTTALLEAQAKDLRVSQLMERIDPFVERMSELMAVQEKPTPAPLVQSELATLAGGLKESCVLLEDLGLPNTLGHIDFNPGNILVSGDHCVFLDWAEGCVTNPLLTFEYLREHMLRSEIKEPVGKRLASAYFLPWVSLHSPKDLRRAMTLASLVAVFAYAVATDCWREPEVGRNRTMAGYFRSLTRRMYREAIHIAERSEPCPA